jgi:hypothetical protein
MLWDYIPQILISVVAFVLIIGVGYLFNFYHLFLIQRTSPNIEQQEPAQRVEGRIEVPVHAYIVRSESVYGSTHTQADIQRIVSNGSRVWQQAGIALSLATTTQITLSRDEVQRLLQNPYEYRDALPGYSEEQVNALFVKTLQGINGVSVGARVVAVADYTSGYDFRVFAHEVGHLFGLSHEGVPQGDRLMAYSGNGDRLTEREIQIARRTARALR